MEAEKDKLHNYINTDSVNEPSKDFTSSVMARVEQMANAPLVIKPLISKRAWLFICLAAAVVIAGSFVIEFAGTIQEMPSFFSWPDIQFKDFETSFKIVVAVVSLLTVLTMADLLYRKIKNIA